MSLLRQLFGKPAAGTPLPPLEDAVVGTLVWNKDSEGWVGSVGQPSLGAQLYLGVGSAHEYPGDDMLALVREPYRRFEELSRTALQYLLASPEVSQGGVPPEAFRVTGLESYRHYLPEGTYTITFANDEDKAVWMVHFQDLQPKSCGVDD
jgi:hypothetical protein